MKSIYAVVKEHSEYQFVCKLSRRDIDDNGDYGIEQIVREWCNRNGLTFVNYAI